MTVGPIDDLPRSTSGPGNGAVWSATRPPVTILYQRADEERHEVRTAPDFFRDLHLDRIVATAIAGREEYDLAPFFQTALTDRDAIAYRQEVMRDLEEPGLRQAIDAFAGRMKLTRKHLTSESKAYYAREKQRWRVAAAESFTEAAEQLARDLSANAPSSPGLRAFEDALDEYLASDMFRALASETHDLARRLADIRYSLLIKDGSVRVRLYEGRPTTALRWRRHFTSSRKGRSATSASSPRRASASTTSTPRS